VDATSDPLKSEQIPAQRRHLADRLGLPGTLPPVRIRPRSELADAARASRLLARAHAAAVWVGEDGRPCPDGRRLSDETPAMAALGCSRADFRRIWAVAAASVYLRFGSGRVSAIGAPWPGVGDLAALMIWRPALNAVLDPDLLTALGEGRVRFAAGPGSMMILLFLSRQDGVPVPQLSELMRQSADSDQAAWQAWVAAHGDPATILLGWLADLGAVEIIDVPVHSPDVAIRFPLRDGEVWDRGGEVARLTPLGTWAMREQLTEGGIGIPLLPEPEDMTVAELVALSRMARPQEQIDETSAWLLSRDPVQSARDLLALAAEAGPPERMRAMVLASGILKDRTGADTAEEVWRQALDRRALRACAIVELMGLGHGDIELSDDDAAWMLVDLVVAHSDGIPPSLVPERLEIALDGAGDRLTELIGLLPGCVHPFTRQALELLGRYHADPSAAEGARTVLYRLTSQEN
jgi:hypothetical protein